MDEVLQALMRVLDHRLDRGRALARPFRTFSTLRLPLLFLFFDASQE
jgi:hypothetical protein